MARLSERFNIVYGIKPADAGGAVATLESVHMGRVKRITYLIQFGALTGNAALTLKSGATDGVQTTGETFRYRLADAAQGSATADTFAAWSTSSSLTLTAATYANKMLVVEIDSDELTAGQPWLTGEFSNITALNLAFAMVAEPRYEAHDPLTII